MVHPKERAVAVHLARFPEALATAIDELAPNRITEFLYDLTDVFNSFYTDCKAPAPRTLHPAQSPAPHVSYAGCCWLGREYITHI